MKYYRDLRDFIKVLEEEDELVRIKTPVSRDLEISEIYFRQIRSPGGGKALLFENVEGSNLPVLINAFGSKKRMDLALGRRTSREGAPGKVDQIVEELRGLMRLMQFKPPKSAGEIASLAGKAAGILRYPPRRRRFFKAPCQEIVLTGDQIDLDQIPILKSWPLDAGRFVTLGMTLTRSLDGTTKNLGLYRMQVLDKRTTAMHWQIHKDGSHFYGEYQREKKRMPVSVVFGGDPSIPFSGIAPLPPKMYELLLAGFIRGSGVPVARCVTNDLEVPAFAEIVFEGYVDPDDLVLEGPFGDHTGYYTPVEPFPKFHLTAITMRRNAIYPATVVGRSPQEDCYLAQGIEKIFLPMLQFIAPEVQDQMLPWDGCFHNCAVLSVSKHFPFQARKLMNHLWGFSQMSFSKSLVMVDPGFPLSDDVNLLNHVLDRLDLATDVVITEGVLDQLDHSGVRPLYGGKIGLDVTTKLAEEKTARIVGTFARDQRAVLAEWKEKLNQGGVPVRFSRLFGAVRRNPVVIFSVEKNGGKIHERVRDILNLAGCSSFPATILLLLDAKDNPEDGSLVLWKLFGNTDALRDVLFVKNDSAPGGVFAVVDATSKNREDGYDRSWPEENLMDEATIRLVDQKWKEMFGRDPQPVARP